MLMRRAFTLVETIAAITITIVAAAVIVPTVVRKMRDARVAMVASEMNTIVRAANAFYRDTGQWPGTLNHLAFSIQTSEDDACGQDYSTNATNGWRGPYIGMSVVANTMPLGEFTLRDTISDAVAPVQGVDNLMITVNDVDLEVLDALDFQFDTPTTGPGEQTADLATGQVRAVGLGTTSGTLNFYYAIRC